MATSSSAKDSSPDRLHAGVGVVGSWRLLELRSGGAYGSVFRAEPLHQPGAGPFAVKVAQHPMDPRFQREAELLRLVHHPHIPRLYDSGLWQHPVGPFPFLVMQWLEGLSLYAWAHGRVLTTRQLMRVLAPLARALAATHAAGAVHRDVKGDNMLVRPEDGFPMLLDFGAGDYQGAPPLTHEVLPPGTPEYRSPESLLFRWRNRHNPDARYKPGPADDLYSYGVTIYRLVTGTYPLMRVPTEVRREEPSLPDTQYEPLEQLSTVSPELANLTRQLLSADPCKRGSAAQVALALEEAVRTAGPLADIPVVRRFSVAPPARILRTSSPRGVWLDRPWLGTAAGLVATAGLVTALVLHLPRTPEHTAPPGPPEDPARSERQEDGEDAGVSLAKEVAMMSARLEQPQPSWAPLTVQVPKTPLPGQARPPCKRQGSVEINGGCWWGRPEATLPCREGLYEWGNRCFHPVLVSDLPATSEER